MDPGGAGRGRRGGLKTKKKKTGPRGEAKADPAGNQKKLKQPKKKPSARVFWGGEEETKKSMLSYDSLLKEGHRAKVWQYSLADRKHSILYLDGPDAGATRFFLKTAGIPARRLCPVNWEERACHAISKHGVQPTWDCIRNVLRRAAESKKRYSVVWLDLECRFVEEECLRDALLTSNCVVLTLSSRGASAEAVVACAEQLAGRAKGRVTEKGQYAGRSGVVNMVHMVIEKKLPPPSASVKKQHWSHIGICKQAAKLIGKTVSVPQSEWPRQTWEKDYRGVKRHGKGFLFQVSRVYRKNRLALRAVMEDSKLASKEESWVLTPSKVMEWDLSKEK